MYHVVPRPDRSTIIRDDCEDPKSIAEQHDKGVQHDSGTRASCRKLWLIRFLTQAPLTTGRALFRGKTKELETGSNVARSTPENLVTPALRMPWSTACEWSIRPRMRLQTLATDLQHSTGEVLCNPFELKRAR